MSRRALRKIDPALDLSRHLKVLDDQPAPFEIAKLFHRDAPLEIEIGSGKGLFLVTAAALHSDRNFLGIELAKKYARFAAARLAKAQLANGMVLEGDGLKLLSDFLPAGSIRAVHVYFPDPWWKKRHKKRRVMNEACLHRVERVLSPGGSLHFWTDVEEYFQSTLELIAAHTKLRGPLTVVEKEAESELDYRTHFERRMRLNNLPVYRSEFRKEQ